jgi:putative PIN family toxin of toxin-antitoxin system
MKVVLDTKVFVSSFMSARGAPWKLIELWKRGEIVLCLSDQIITEYINVLLRVGLKGEEEIGELIELLRRGINIVIVSPDEALELIADDPGDDKFIECAIVANAEFIISEDKHLIDFKRYKKVKLVTPSVFIKQHSKKK